MKTSLNRNFAIVAMLGIVISGCQTASKVQITDADWNDVNFNSDRGIANIGQPVLKELFDLLPTTEKKVEFLRFIVREGGELGSISAELAPKIKNARTYSAKEVEEFGQILSKNTDNQSVKAQEEFFYKKISQQKQYRKIIGDNLELMQKYTRIKNTYLQAGTSTTQATIKKPGAVATVVSAADAQAAGAKIISPAEYYKTALKQIDELPIDAAEKATLKKAIREYVETGITIRKLTGTSVFDLNGCKNLVDAESIATLQKEADDYIATFRRTGKACATTYAGVAVVNHMNKLGRSPAAAADAVDGYNSCGYGVEGLSNSIWKKDFRAAILQAEKTGSKSLPASVIENCD